MTRSKVDKSGRWPVSGYVQHVSLGRENRSTFKVVCSECGAHEMIPDVAGDDIATVKSFNLAVQGFTNSHTTCGGER